VVALLNFGNDEAECLLAVPEGNWVKVIDSAAGEWDGPGSNLPDAVESGQAVRLRPHSFALFERS
jgi:maltooligosyltrehalose trehalohydrolase